MANWKWLLLLLLSCLLVVDRPAAQSVYAVKRPRSRLTGRASESSMSRRRPLAHLSRPPLRGNPKPRPGSTKAYRMRSSAQSTARGRASNSLPSSLPQRSNAMTTGKPGTQDAGDFSRVNTSGPRSTAANSARLRAQAKRSPRSFTPSVSRPKDLTFPRRGVIRGQQRR